MKYGVTEAMLRPPVELYSAATAGSIGIIAATAPWALMLSPGLGYAAAGVATGFALYRGNHGFQVLRYTIGLTKYKISSVAPHKLPRIPERLYMGQGFEWTQRHTQRLADARRPDARDFLTPSPLGNLTAKACRKLVKRAGRAKLPGFSNVCNALLAPRWWNPIADIPDLGGSPLLHGVEPNEVAVSLSQKHRVGHMLVIGTTRVGKTRLMELLVTQDIRDGDCCIVIDPKGDADLMMRVYAEAARAGRLDQLYVFHLGYPEFSARYNGIGNFARITEVANRATNALPNGGNSAAFKEFAWRFTNLIAQAQVALGMVPTYDLLLRDITDIEPLFVRYSEHVLGKLGPTGWLKKIEAIEAAIQTKKYAVPRALQDRTPRLIALVHVLKELQLPEPVVQGLASAVRYERTFFEKIVASLGPFLEKLTTGAVGKLISPDYFDTEDKRPIFDWMSVIRQKGIVYVGLDALSDPVVASAVGNSMLADLVSVGGKLYKTGLDPHHPEGKITLPTVNCHFDEVNELMGPEFVPMVNKMGGSGFRIHAYTQTIPDIEARLGDTAKAKQVLGNFNHLVMLRVKSAETAQFFTDQLPKVDVTTLTSVSGVTDTSADQGPVDFVSRNEDRVSTTQTEMLTPADIMAQPQGQAFALLEGNRLHHIRMPLPVSAADDEFLPESLRSIGDAMRARYHTSEGWASENDWLQDMPIGLAGSPALLDAGEIVFDTAIPETVDAPYPLVEQSNNAVAPGAV